MTKESEKKLNEEEAWQESYKPPAWDLLEKIQNDIAWEPLSYTKRRDGKYQTEWATFEVIKYGYLEIRLKMPMEVIQHESK